MIKREVEKSIKEVNDTFRVLALTGPRQVGKTTILKSIMPKNMKIVSLDNETLQGNVAIDLGCGTGNDTTFLLENGFKVTAIDQEEQVKDFIKNKNIFF